MHQHTWGATHLHTPATMRAWKGLAGRPSVFISGHAAGGHGKPAPINLLQGMPSGFEFLRDAHASQQLPRMPYLKPQSCMEWN